MYLLKTFSKHQNVSSFQFCILNIFLVMVIDIIYYRHTAMKKQIGESCFDCVRNVPYILRKRAFQYHTKYLKISTVGLNAASWRFPFCVVIVIVFSCVCDMIHLFVSSWLCIYGILRQWSWLNPDNYCDSMRFLLVQSA